MCSSVSATLLPSNGEVDLGPLWPWDEDELDHEGGLDHDGHVDPDLDGGTLLEAAQTTRTGEAAGHSPWQRFAHLFRLDPRDPGEPRPADTELVRRLRDCEALISQLTAEQSRALLELRRRRLVGQAAAHPHEEGACPSACCDEDGWVAPEVGVELGLSERQVESRIDTALRLARHRAVESAMDDGLLQAWTATRLLEHLDQLAAYVSVSELMSVEAGTVAWLLARPRTVSQLNARMRRLLLAAKAADEAERRDSPDVDDAPEPDGREPAHADRRVSITPGATPGLAELVAWLPESDALAIRAALYSLGHDPADADDGRTAEQRRADLLVTLVTGRAALNGRPGDTPCAIRPPIDLQVRLDVSIPVTSLVGSGGAPAWVPGFGDIAATTARDLADARSRTGCPGPAAEPEARPLVYDPRTGDLLGFASHPVRMVWLDELRPERGYQHSTTLETAVRLRDGTCRASGCLRRASRCDCDHAVPYPAGATSLGNTCSLCRYHHRLKTHAAGWRLQASPDGRVTWTTPTGRSVTTDPYDYRPPELAVHDAAARAPSEPDPPPF